VGPSHQRDRPSGHEGLLRIAVDARLKSGLSGGVESVVIGLASGLSRLKDGHEEYLFLANEGDEDWIRPHLVEPARLLLVPGQPRNDMSATLRGNLKRAFPTLASAWRRRFSHPGPPMSDGSIERAGALVMHFTSQHGFRTTVPSIYHPHDLQHIHLPEFFTEEQREWREVWYRTLCEQAEMVAVASSWTKSDVERHYGLPPGKVQVVPLAPPTAEYAQPTDAQVADVAARLSLPDSYVLYPAQTWAHKNHLGLLNALAELRNREGLVLHLVAPGHQNEFFPEIVRRVSELGIGDQVHWLGFVSPVELQDLYRRARCVVVPSRFEAASGPLWEAFLAGSPAACSNVTSLPEQAGDAALVFDPDDAGQLVSVLRRLWVDEDLRSQLAIAGRRRVAAFTWDRTARIFRAHYRRIAGRALTDEEKLLLASPPPL
jgi:glycosyltransferase involved in cell wall biosynthesis